MVGIIWPPSTPGSRTEATDSNSVPNLLFALFSEALNSLGVEASSNKALGRASARCPFL